MLASSPDRLFASASDHRECRALIRTGSRSFFAASRLLPAHMRRPAFGLYAFCRLSDDVVDLEGGSAPALARLRQRLARAHRGSRCPPTPSRSKFCRRCWRGWNGMRRGDATARSATCKLTRRAWPARSA